MQYQYLNIIIVGALVIYLAFKIYEDIRLGMTENMTFRILLLVFGIGILIFRILKLRKRTDN